ncbi:MAG: HAD hydrolase-like protein [Clostridia bacterium]|nr:HAD hydrolase-like protein [Clostridia bacterium]
MDKKGYEYILFDLDGTIVDSGEGITNAVMYALKAFGMSVADRSELYCFIGPPLMDSFQRFFGFSREEAWRAVTEYRVYYREKGLYENTVYPGTEDMLGRLNAAGKRVILATAKPEEFAKTVIEHEGLGKYFAFIGGAEMETASGRARQRKDEVIAYVMESCGITDPKRALMVGDRAGDVEGAAANGMDCVGVLYGYGSREELEGAGAHRLAQSPEEVFRIACGLEPE